MYFLHFLILCHLSGSKYSSQLPVLRHCLCDSCHVKGKFSCLLKQHVIMVTDVLGIVFIHFCYVFHNLDC